MGLKEVWGFDPDEAAKAQNAFRGVSEAQSSPESVAENLMARIPANVEAQIYELRRIFRL